MHEELKKRADAIRKWNEGLTTGVTLRLVRTEGPQSRAIERFATGLHDLAPKIVVEEAAGLNGDLPGMLIGESWAFHFVPEGMELDPFMDLLSAIDRGEADIRDDIRGILKNHSGRIPLTLYLSTHCPNCPAVMRQIGPLPLVNPGIHVTAIDGLLFPDLASAERIQSVPTLIGEGGLRWTGQIRLESVIEVLVERGEAGYTREILEEMITQGNAGPLADMMIRAGRLFPAFMDLLTSDLFSLRLGAMVVMEDLAERAPDLARSVLEPLWKRMSGVDEAVQGDILYLIGVIGDPTWIPRLASFMEKGLSPDLEEAAREALESLGGDNGP
ncbi:MAG: thioredoxin family protein [Deltaproteobacteria bacterium]|nr:thioredoxin family protein [Deltaproteobacteria bacterium]